MAEKVIKIRKPDNPATLVVGLLALAGAFYAARWIFRLNPELAADAAVPRRVAEVFAVAEEFDEPLMVPYI
jgi:hypothetical protein